MKKTIIAPSILSSNFYNLQHDAELLKECGADILHVDVMDGCFVPNITIGQAFVQSICKSVALPMDVHLMIDRPERFIEDYAVENVNNICVHPEATAHLDRALQQIIDTGIKTGVSLNPSTPLSAIEWVIDKVDLILIMTVNPGFGGQKFIEAMLPKIEKTRELIAAAGREITLAVDGGVTGDNAGRIIAAGAGYLVSGSYILANSELSPGQAIERLRNPGTSL